jgi:hypothetical protein
LGGIESGRSAPSQTCLPRGFFVLVGLFSWACLVHIVTNDVHLLK